MAAVEFPIQPTSRLTPPRRASYSPAEGTPVDRPVLARATGPVPGSGGNKIEAIGVNRPLTIEIAYVHTGIPTRGMGDDLLVTSSVKKLPVYASAPRAVNALVPDLRKGMDTRFDALPANLNATPVVYHSPAQTERGVVVTIELVWNRFNNELVQRVAGFLGGAAGIPLFAPAGSYLLAGSVLLKSIGNLLERLIDGRALFADTLTLSLGRPGLEDTPASYHVLFGNSIAIERWVRSDSTRFEPGRGLVNKQTGESIAVAEPYVVLIAYGNERPDYSGFVPTMASASLLETFFHAGQAERPITDDVLDLLRSVNDLNYRDTAQRLGAAVGQLDASDADYQAKLTELKAEFDAANKNIGDAGLRIDWPLK